MSRVRWDLCIGLGRRHRENVRTQLTAPTHSPSFQPANRPTGCCKAAIPCSTSADSSAFDILDRYAGAEEHRGHR